MRKIFLALFAAATLSAQKPPLSKQEEILIRLDKLEAQNTEILKILKEADAPAQPVHLKVDIKDEPVIGDDNAPVTIVEFTDFQCPFCSKFHTETFPKLREAFISTGKVRFVSRDLPLPMHANAGKAAEAGRCAGEQGQFWAMRDWMQTNPTKLSLEDLQAHAVEIKLDTEKYRLCMASAQYREAVIASGEEAKSLNITGTPTFVIGKTGTSIDGEVLVGAQPLAAFERAILAVK